MNAKAAAIKAAGEYAMQRWPPADDRTFCNIATAHIASVAGYAGFRGMVANDIVKLMSSSPDFAKVAPVAAQALANDGRLVIAGICGEAHGHVAVIAPGGELFYSKKWRQDCPVVMNTGKTNGIMSASWAFSEEPAYFSWIESV